MLLRQLHWRDPPLPLEWLPGHHPALLPEQDIRQVSQNSARGLPCAVAPPAGRRLLCEILSARGLVVIFSLSSVPWQVRPVLGVCRCGGDLASSAGPPLPSCHLLRGSPLLLPAAAGGPGLLHRGRAAARGRRGPGLVSPSGGFPLACSGHISSRGS